MQLSLQIVESIAFLFSLVFIAHAQQARWHGERESNTSLTSTADSTFTVRIRGKSQLCLDLAGGRAENGARVQMWDCNGLGNQNWLLPSGGWKIQYAADPSKCIDAGNAQNGAALQLWDCNGLVQQKWGYDSRMGTLYLAASENDASKCMDLMGGKWQGGATVQVWACNGLWQQSWDLSSTGGGQGGNTVVVHNALDNSRCGNPTVSVFCSQCSQGGVVIQRGNSQRFQGPFGGNSPLGIQVNNWFWASERGPVGTAPPNKFQNPDNSGGEFMISTDCQMTHTAPWFGKGIPTYEIANVAISKGNQECIVTLTSNACTNAVTPGCCSPSSCRATDFGKTENSQCHLWANADSWRNASVLVV